MGPEQDTRVPRPGKEPLQFRNTKLSPGRLHNFGSVSRLVPKAGPQTFSLLETGESEGGGFSLCLIE